jgi:hypothetical protein
MGRIDMSKGQDSRLDRYHINVMLRYIDEYELVKQKIQADLNTAQKFYDLHGICKQNFLKYYRKYLLSNSDIKALIRQKSARKFKDALQYES